MFLENMTVQILAYKSYAHQWYSNLEFSYPVWDLSIYSRIQVQDPNGKKSLHNISVPNLHGENIYNN